MEHGKGSGWGRRSCFGLAMWERPQSVLGPNSRGKGEVPSWFLFLGSSAQAGATGIRSRDAPGADGR